MTFHLYINKREKKTKQQKGHKKISRALENRKKWEMTFHLIFRKNQNKSKKKHPDRDFSSINRIE